MWPPPGRTCSDLVEYSRRAHQGQLWPPLGLGVPKLNVPSQRSLSIGCVGGRGRGGARPGA
eukprot:5291588-Alexandrium_andersonii.AAC.1